MEARFEDLLKSAEVECKTRHFITVENVRNNFHVEL